MDIAKGKGTSARSQSRRPLENRQDADRPSADRQARAIYEYNSIARSMRAAKLVGEHPEPGAQIEIIKSEIGDKEQKVAKLNRQLASKRKRIRDIEDGLIEEQVDVALLPEASPSLAPSEETDGPSSIETKTTPIAATEDDPAVAELVTAWERAEEFRRAWVEAPELARERFISIVLKGAHHDVK
jgi:hypothetical protein